MHIKTQIAGKIMNEINDYLERKDSLDNILNLSQESTEKECLSVNKVENSEGYMTLLSEGSVLYQDGTIRLYLCKGTLKNWYDSIDETFEGYVSTGHRDLNSYPVREGYFRKSDLKLVQDDNGRYDLLVKPHVNTQLSNVKDIILQDEPFAISSEFLWYHKDIGDDDIEEYAKLIAYNVEHGGDIDVPITDKVEITGFSFVGNPGNAKSGGYDPSLLVRNEEEHLKNKEILEKVLAHLSAQVEPEEVKEDEVLEEAPVVEEEPKAEEAEEAEEKVEEATEEPKEEEAKSEESQALAQAIEAIEALTAENEALKAEIATKDAIIAEKEANEDAVEGQLSKLAVLLEKANPVVEKASKVVEEEQPKNRFGRVRFGGQ